MWSLEKTYLLIVALVAKSSREAQGILFDSGGDQSQLTQKQFNDSNE